MLGFSPISARAISGSPFSLTVVSAALAATASIAFTVSGTAGAIVHPAATVGISFPVSGRLIVHQALTATASITFTVAGDLKVAGRPIVLAAIPQSFELRATQGSMSLKAMPQSFTIRSAR
jgi:hypothetical protein